MSRVLWKGSISFGLVNIPVGLYPAGETKSELDLDLIDRRDLSPIGYRKVNKNTGEEVAPENIVRGYQLENGQYVLVERDDLRRAASEKTQTIDIVSFAKFEEIRPYFFETPYYLEPLPAGRKGYALLRQALHDSGRVGIAKVVIRTRQRLCALLADGPALVLDTLRYADELRDPAALELPPQDPAKLEIRTKEVEMAQRLIEDMVEPWKPEKYRDEYRDEVLSFIKEKAKKGGAKELRATAEERPAKAPKGDLMSLLKKSLAEGRPRRGKTA